jgi:hypothetical protein
MSQNSVILVSGLPRSGTSMMMKMLEAGGVEALTDKLRAADEDNPRGYFEFEKVKKLKEDSAWLDGAVGKSVKVISQLLYDLPAEYHYKVVFMRRKIEEILASQQEMLIRRGQADGGANDKKLYELFERHLGEVEQWLAQRDDFDVFYVSYNDILASPRQTSALINSFLGGQLDEEKMAAAVDQDLYRQRKQS